MSDKRIVKAKKFTEGYNREKLQKSIHAACLSVRELAGSAELTSHHVCSHVENWLNQKYEVTSADIRRVAASVLQKYNPDAAYVYLTHNQLN